MNNPGHISESLDIIFWVKILKFFDADPGNGIEKFRSRIRDKYPGSATLATSHIIDLVWLYRSPIQVGKEGGFLLAHGDYYLPSRRSRVGRGKEHNLCFCSHVSSRCTVRQNCYY
jgi:hypothetical protein